VEQVIARLKRLRSPQLRESVDSLIRYFNANATRMRNTSICGWDTGSAAEPSVAPVVHARMRQAGMRLSGPPAGAAYAAAEWRRGGAGTFNLVSAA